MICQNCKTEISNTAKFCYKCGYEISKQVNQNIEDDFIIYKLKPKFDIFYKFLNTFFRVILFILIMNETISLLNDTMSTIFLVLIFIYILGDLIIQKMQYDKLEYNFYKEKVEYKDGFFNKEEKELKYSSIREVTMSQNVLERFCGIGKIKIYTTASNNNYNRKNSRSFQNGIFIHCVSNVEKQYKTIKKIIDEGTKN